LFGHEVMSHFNITSVHQERSLRLQKQSL